MEPEGSLLYSIQKRPPLSLLIQSTSSHVIPFKSILTLSCHLHLRAPKGVFLSGFPTKNVNALSCHVVRVRIVNNVMFVYSYSSFVCE
jgi:hypothetical protein